MMWNFEKFGNRTALLDDSGMSVTYAEIVGWEEQFNQAAEHRCLVFLYCRNEIRLQHPRHRQSFPEGLTS